MKKSIGKNYIYNVIYQVFTLLIPLITTPYVAKVLSVDGIGTYSFTYSIAYFFSIFAELGSIAYARREIAYCQDDKEKRSIIFWEILLFRIFTTIMCLAVYIIYIVNSEYLVIGLIQMIYIIAVIFDITWFFQGMEEFKTVVVRNTIIKILVMIFIFTFVKSEGDLIIYIFGLAILPLISNIVTWTTLPKYIKKIPIKSLRPFRHLKGTFALFIPNIASQVYLLLDKTMLGFLTVDNVENGYYEQAQKIIKMSWTFLTTFAAVMAPRIAFFVGKNDRESLKKYIRNSFSFTWLIASALCFGIISIASNLVPWFLGVNYDKVVTLLIIFSFILFPIGITCVTGTQYLVTIKRQKVYTISIITGAVLNLIMNWILIPKYYSIGTAISSVAAEFIIAVIQVIYVVYYLKEIEIKDVFLHAWQYLLAGFIMFIVLNYISGFLTANIYNSIILILIGATIYFITLIILRNELVLQGINKMKNIGKKLINKNNI